MNLNTLFEFILTTSIYASIVGVVILFVKFIFNDTLSSTWQYVIWFVLIFKLIVPFGPESSISLFNVAKPQVIMNSETKNVSKIFIEDDINHLEQNNEVLEKLTPEENVLNISDIASHIWLTGSLFMLLWFAFTNISLKMKLHKNNIRIDKRIKDILDICEAKTKIKKEIELIEQNYILSPSLYGIINPKILVPSSINTLTDKEIEYILLHELSHYKRGDTITNYILIVLQILHWFNPIVWYYFKRIRHDMEIATDQKAMLYIESTEYKDYGKALLLILENFSAPKIESQLLCIADDKKSIIRRVKMIAKFKKPKVLWSILSITLIVTVGGICLTDAQSQNMKSEHIEAVGSLEQNETIEKIDSNGIKDESNARIESELSESKTNDAFSKDIEYIEKHPMLITPEIKIDQQSVIPPEKHIDDEMLIPKPEKEPEVYSEKQMSPQQEKSKDGFPQVHIKQNPLLPGTSFNSMLNYLNQQGKSINNNGNCNLSESYCIVNYVLKDAQKDILKTVVPDKNGTATFYIKNQTSNRLMIEVIEKETGQLLITGVFKGNSYTSYSCEGLDIKKEYELYISKQESQLESDTEIAGSIIIY